MATPVLRQGHQSYTWGQDLEPGQQISLQSMLTTAYGNPHPFPFLAI